MVSCLCVFFDAAGRDDGLRCVQKHRVCRLQFPKLEDGFHLPNGELTRQVVLQALRAHIPMLGCQGNECLIVKQMIQIWGHLGGGNIDHIFHIIS